MKESVFQRNLKAELQERFPGCIVMKQDASIRQGFPDLLILYKNHWAALECKTAKHHQPNQDYYVNQLNGMSYAAFINPENKEDILNEIQKAFQS